MADGELSQLDERLREVAESLAAIGTSVKTLEGQVTTMNKALFQGNGHPSLMTRVEVLELGQTSFAKQCSDCKAIALDRQQGRGSRRVAHVDCGGTMEGDYSHYHGGAGLAGDHRRVG